MKTALEKGDHKQRDVLTTSIPEEVVNLVNEYVDSLKKSKDVSIKQFTARCSPSNRRTLTGLLNLAKATGATVKSLLQGGDIATSKRESKQRLFKRISSN